jgi:hypothetical protein
MLPNAAAACTRDAPSIDWGNAAELGRDRADESMMAMDENATFDESSEWAGHCETRPKGLLARK